MSPTAGQTQVRLIHQQHTQQPRSANALANVLQVLEPLNEARSWPPPALAWSLLLASATLGGAVSMCDAVALAEKQNEEEEIQKHSSLESETEAKPVPVPLRRRSTSKRERLLISTSAVRGDRSYMEDAWFVSPCKRFAGVYDGHGGAEVSNYLRRHLFALISPDLTRLDSEMDDTQPSKDKKAVEKMKQAQRQQIEQLIRDAVNKVDADVLARSDWKHEGSTATGTLVLDDMIYAFNVGDSRAILSRDGQAVALTRDHKPNDPTEQARVESLGGTVKWYGYVDAQGEPIEPYGAYRVNGNLAVARAIGDRDLRPYVCGEVDIRQVPRDFAKDEFIVVASDGLWDVFTNDEVVTFVHDVMSGELGGRESWRSGGHSDTRVPIFEWTHQYPKDRAMIKAAHTRRKTQIANYLVQEALFRGTMDNVSVVVVWLR